MTTGARNSVLADTGAGYRALFRDHCRSFIKTAALPVLLSMALIVLSDWLDPDPQLEADIAAWLPSLVTLFLLDIFPVTLFAVAWYRVVIIGDGAADPPWAWGRRHWRCLGYGLLLQLSVYLLLLFGGGLAFAILIGSGDAWRDADPESLFASCLAIFAATALFALPFVFYWVARMSFVFPAAAIDRVYQLADAWRDTRGLGVKLATAVALGIGPMFSLSLLVEISAVFVPCGEPGVEETCATTTGTIAVWFLNLLAILPQYLCYAVAVAIIARAFQQHGSGKGSAPA